MKGLESCQVLNECQAVLQRPTHKGALYVAVSRTAYCIDGVTVALSAPSTHLWAFNATDKLLATAILLHALQGILGVIVSPYTR
jgi:hypothetical protein